MRRRAIVSVHQIEDSHTQVVYRLDAIADSAHSTVSHSDESRVGFCKQNSHSLQRRVASP